MYFLYISVLICPAVSKVLSVTCHLKMALKTDGEVLTSELLKECNSATICLEQSMKQTKRRDETVEVPSLFKVDVWVINSSDIR